MTAAPDLSVVIVNFNSARFLPGLVDSIRMQDWRIDGRRGRTEIILIDNASKGEDAAALLALAAGDVRVLINTANTGYGQANNQGFHLARGAYHMVLNPDARLLPGAVAALVGHLEAHPEHAMACPKSFLDPAGSVLVPPNQLPTPELFELQTDAQVDHDAAHRNLRQRTRATYDYWTAEEPLELDMLSGSCLLFRRELFRDELPFDPGFPLYYEDTDMFQRLAKRGERMVHVPAASILHFWSQSADTHARGAAWRGRISERRYYEKHFGAEGLASYERNRRRAEETREAGTHIVPFEFVEVQAGAAPPSFAVDRPADAYYVEFAGNPIFTLAAGLFPREDGPFSVAQGMWDQLGPGRYYIRAVDRETLETFATWTVVKS